MLFPGAFITGGKFYGSMGQLAHQKLKGSLGGDYSVTLYRDVFGHPAIDEYKRVPSFDNYDAMHDNRAHHWHYLFTGNRIARIGHMAPRGATVRITDNVKAISNDVYRALKAESHLDTDGWLTLPM